MGKNYLYHWISVSVLIIIIVALAASFFSSKILNPDFKISSFPNEELSADENFALIQAISIEYKAKALYEKAGSQFNSNIFYNIADSEKKHIELLSVVFEKYGIIIPEDIYSGNITNFNSVKEACVSGVEAEIEVIELYNSLLKKVNNQDIVSVFNSLKDSSELKHLVAFKKCVE